MQPTIVLGDIHGSTYWKHVIADNSDCRYIFLGDYLDPYEYVPRRELLGNLRQLIAFKQEHPQDVVLLLGNHDLHYFMEEVETCSRFDLQIAMRVADIFHENRRLFRFAFQDGNYIFTHAGISQGWFDNDFRGDSNRNIAEQLNHPTPGLQELTLFNCGRLRGGSDRNSGIFWADTEELNEPLQGFTQVVGHNRVADILEHSNDNARIIFCDCLWNGRYLKLI
jgi:hypothetical protein